MNTKIFIRLFLCATMITLGCSKDNSGSEKINESRQAPLLREGVGASQISGVGFLAESTECDFESQGAAYAVRMTGDLTGCLYVYVDSFACSPSGTYREIGREYFVGTYNGESGTFWTNYKFEAKYEGCADNGSYLGAEIFGRCQHPIEEGSGTGVFEGVTGRLDMKDDIEEGNYPYRGHLKY